MDEKDTSKNISPSEAKMWLECGWRHKLVYIEKLGTYEDSIYTDFGTYVHGAVEKYLKERTLNIDLEIEGFSQIWEKRGYPGEKWPKWKSAVPDLNYWLTSLRQTLTEAPDFIETSFPGWKLISAEERLHVPVTEDIKFKGFVDCIISVPGENSDVIYILDWKTSSSSGWSKQKILDLGINLQPQLYRKFWCQRENIDITQVKSGFVLLKRLEVTKSKKQQKFFEYIEVPYDEKKTQMAVDVIHRMAKNLMNNRYIKNRDACTFCEFFQTKHCKI